MLRRQTKHLPQLHHSSSHTRYRDLRTSPASSPFFCNSHFTMTIKGQHILPISILLPCLHSSPFLCWPLTSFRCHYCCHPEAGLLEFIHSLSIVPLSSCFHQSILDSLPLHISRVWTLTLHSLSTTNFTLYTLHSLEAYINYLQNVLSVSTCIGCGRRSFRQLRPGPHGEFEVTSSLHQIIQVLTNI